jgi:hypothetical protein
MNKKQRKGKEDDVCVCVGGWVCVYVCVRCVWECTNKKNAGKRNMGRIQNYDKEEKRSINREA